MDRKLAWERVKRFLDDDDDDEEEAKEDETAKTSGSYHHLLHIMCGYQCDKAVN